MAKDKEVKVDYKEMLENLITGRNKVYFEMNRVSTRHEAWFMASALSNMVIIDKLDEMIKLLRKK